MDYLKQAGFIEALQKLDFDLVGFGCTTCIGNSRPLDENISSAIEKGNLVAASVLSGNRNFEGRINPYTKASYLVSPPLVIAYALAGRIDFDPLTEPIENLKDGTPVFLKDIWPSQAEIEAAVSESVKTGDVPLTLRESIRRRRKVDGAEGS